MVSRVCLKGLDWFDKIILTPNQSQRGKTQKNLRIQSGVPHLEGKTTNPRNDTNKISKRDQQKKEGVSYNIGLNSQILILRLNGTLIFKAYTLLKMRVKYEFYTKILKRGSSFILSLESKPWKLHLISGFFSPRNEYKCV